MIADTLRQDKNNVVGGEVSVNGFSPRDKGIVWSNLTAHIDQIDRLHPYLTVEETLKFAWHCRSGGTHMKPFYDTNDAEVQSFVTKLDEEYWTVKTVLAGLGLTRCKDTFVGDNTSVRGVSGGEKKRVTVAEMSVIGVPVICCDEISTGLDGKCCGAATACCLIRTM